MNQRHKDFTQATAVAPSSFAASRSALPLYGDYELLIDEALGGDQRLKERVAAADAVGRGGLAVLKNALKNRGITLRGKLLDILLSCELDQEAFEASLNDLRNIEVRGGSYRAKVQIDDNVFKSSFKTLREAQVWRDRMLILKGDTIVG